MNKISIKILLLFFVFKSLNCYSQNQEKDSIEIAKISTEFYSWYISSSTNKMNGNCVPTFIEDKNGMTTIDFSKYIKNLFEHSFSDTLIAKEKLSYQVCINNLAQVKYADFLKFDGLDDFEKRGCDFTNYYRWTGGQEMFEKFSLTSIEIVNKSALLQGFLSNKNDDINEKNSLKKIVSMVFIKQKNKWKILDINY